METVKLALEIGMPVIAILVRAGEVRIAVYRQANDRPHANRAWAEASEVAPEKAPWRSGAKDVIQYLLAFPHSISGPDQRHDYERRKSLTSAVKRLRLLQNSELYLSKLAKSDLSLRMFQLPWVKIQEMASLWSSKHAFEKPDVPAPGNFQNVSRMKRLKSLMFIGWSLRRKARSSKPRVTVKPYATIYSEASNLAGKLMTIYRGGFVAAFIFAALASLVAVIITGLALYFAKGPPGSESHPWLPLVVGLGVLKIVIIGVLILLERRSEEENWQEAAADFRYLTELMQPMQYLGPLGASIPEVELPAIYTRGDPRQDWVSWLFRACSRGVPSVTVPGEDGAQPEVRFSPERTREILRDARAGWLAGQIDYHKGNAVKYHWLENGLEKIGKRMLEAVIVAAVLLLVMEIVEHHWFSHVIPPGLNAAIVMLSVAVASLPAFIAALGAICFQSEAKRLEQRSEAMLWLLDARVHALNDFERAMDDGNIARSSRRLAQELRISADLVMREALEWKSLYRIHTIKAG